MKTLTPGDHGLIANLRFRWPELCQKYTDEQLVGMYHYFSMTDEFGDNDAEFPNRLKEDWDTVELDRMWREVP